MPIIECSYFDKTGAPAKGLGNLNVSFDDFAHALLSLHVKFGSLSQRHLRLQSYLLQLQCDFRNQSGFFAMNAFPEETYDGIKKSSDVYGAAITVMVAQKLYGYPLVVPLNEGSVISSTGKRPDFLATDETTFSLFESKASIEYVTASAKKAGIEQLRSVSSLNYGPNTVSSFKERVLVATDFRHKVKTPWNQKIKCKVYDPDGDETNDIQLDLKKSLFGYYDFIKRIINHYPRQELCGYDKLPMMVSLITAGDMKLQIGLPCSIYDFNWNQEGALTKFFDLLNEEKNLGEGVYGDGVFLRIQNENIIAA